MIQVNYPTSLANTLRLSPQEFEREIKINSMVKLFEIGKISTGVAANVLGISRLDFIELLSKYKVSVLEGYSEDDLTNDILNA